MVLFHLVDVSTSNNKSIKKFQKNFKRCRDEVPKSKQTRCRDSLSTKLNVHSPIPTSFSHVTATALGHYQYNIILFVGSNVLTCHAC